MALKYPPAAQALIDGVGLPNLRWLTPTMRREMADLVRMLRNDIANTLYERTVQQDPRRAASLWDKASTRGTAHDDAERLLTDWFVARTDGSMRPTFAEADRALSAVRLAPEQGEQHGAPRFGKMSKERRLGYGIPDGYFADGPAVLEHLASMVGLPAGYLLLELRMTNGLSGSKRESLPIRPWLKDRIEFALLSEGVSPHPSAPSTSPVRPAVPVTSTPAITGTRATLTPLARLLDLRNEAGSLQRVFDLIGGSREFERCTGIKARTVESWVYEGKRPRPASALKLEQFLDVVEPLVAQKTTDRMEALGAAVRSHFGVQDALPSVLDRHEPALEPELPPAQLNWCGCDGLGL
ncbi:MAG: hypothetical protein ACOYN3_03740 [Acidimicrobiia bacterium]